MPSLQRSIRIGAPFLSILAVLFVLSLFATSSAYNVAPSATVSSNRTISSVSQSITYDVTLKASPQNQTVAYITGNPNRAAVYVNSTNSGSANFNVTGCVLQYLNSTGQWHGITCTGKVLQSYDPFTIAPHTTNYNFNVGIDYGPTPATYNFRFWWTGTVNGVAYRTKLCTFTIVDQGINL